MPIAKVQMPDGRIAKFDVPEGTTPEQVMAFAQQQDFAQATPTTESSGGPSLMQKAQSSLPGRILQGMRDPIDAGAQLLDNGLQKLGVDTGKISSAANTAAKAVLPDAAADFLFSAKPVNDINAQNEREYQAARQATTPKAISSLVTGKEADPGFDGGRLVGNIVSPANAAIAARLPMTATTALGKAAYGAGVGGLGGLLTPVNELNDGQSYWGTKLTQLGMGAATGGAITPLMSKIGDALGRRLNMMRPDHANAASQANEAIAKALEDVGQKIEDVPQMQLKALQDQVTDALRQGKRLDAAAALRKQDFDALQIPATGGQITRDATQYARERNLRGVAGVGEPLMNRFEQQNQALQKTVGDLGGNTSGEQFAAGQKLADALKRTDDAMRDRVSSLYKEARQSSGKDLNVPLHGLAQDYAEITRNFGDKVPSGVRNRMEELGLMSGNQRKVFSVEDAENLLKTINDNVSNDPATNKALDGLRSAVKNAVLSADDQGGVFAKAREAAAQRFGLQDAVPALKAASTGSTAPDDFVKRFVISGKTNDVKGLAQVLRGADPEAFQEAKNQIGATLQRAAFGENTAGDKIFSPERYAKALRELGTEKLSAFYSPDEIAQLKTISRVGAYINSTPTAAPVNTSNTAGAVANLLTRLPGVPTGAALFNAARNAVNNQRVISQGLAAQPPVGKAELTPDQIATMVKLLSIGSAGAGGMAATPLR